MYLPAKSIRASIAVGSRVGQVIIIVSDSQSVKSPIVVAAAPAIIWTITITG